MASPLVRKHSLPTRAQQQLPSSPGLEDGELDVQAQQEGINISETAPRKTHLGRARSVDASKSLGAALEGFVSRFSVVFRLERESRRGREGSEEGVKGGTKPPTFLPLQPAYRTIEVVRRRVYWIRRLHLSFHA